ncbi:MAG: hypothetical protein V4634_16820 [Pseudomonadota bacterium]
MGYPDWVIFQRTESGRTEIRNKERGLTQSERLVLIIADGVSSYAGLRIKLKSLARERFDRAVRKLMDKGLLFEVMFPEQGQAPDMVDPEVMDRFLKQEDDDPVSIISFDPEEEHGDANLDQNSVARMALQNSRTPSSHIPAQAIPNRAAAISKPLAIGLPAISADLLEPPVTAEPPAVDFYLPLDTTGLSSEKSNAQVGPEMGGLHSSPSRPDSSVAKGARDALRVASTVDTSGMAKAVSVFPEPKSPAPVKPVPKSGSKFLARLRMNSSYVLLFAGISLICAPFLARFMQWLLM